MSQTRKHRKKRYFKCSRCRARMRRNYYQHRLKYVECPKCGWYIVA